jgi:hypothetical protein
MTQHHEDDDLVAEVTAWMEQLATEPLPLSPPPDPALIWLKAQMLRRWDAERRTTAPIDLGEYAQVGFGAAGSLLLLVLFMWRGGASPSSNGPSVVLSIIVSLGLLVSAVILAVWPAVRREGQLRTR